jgi:hypothetical protein
LVAAGRKFMDHAGQPALACAGFTDEQDARILRSDALNVIEQADHFRTITLKQRQLRLRGSDQAREKARKRTHGNTVFLSARGNEKATFGWPPEAT